MPTISSASAIRPRLTLDAICACASSVGADAWKLSVWNVPQTIAFTRMPRGPNSWAAALVRALSPAFAAA